jgi:hypothetical protein
MVRNDTTSTGCLYCRNVDSDDTNLDSYILNFLTLPVRRARAAIRWEGCDA